MLVAVLKKGLTIPTSLDPKGLWVILASVSVLNLLEFVKTRYPNTIYGSEQAPIIALIGFLNIAQNKDYTLLYTATSPEIGLVAYRRPRSGLVVSLL